MKKFDGRGNFTRGEHRRGYRGGRQPSLDRSVQWYNTAFKISESDRAFMTYIGGGNASHGLRVAVELARGHFRNGIPTDLVEAKTLAARNRHAIKREVATALGQPEPVIPKSGSQRIPIDYEAEAQAAAAEWDDIDTSNEESDNVK